MFIIESHQDDETGSTFVGYLAYFNATGFMSFTRERQKAHQFAKQEDCIVSDLQRWEMGRDGGKGHYRVIEIDAQTGVQTKALNFILRKKTLWAEIKAYEQEYERIGKQINELRDAQADVSFRIQKKMGESQSIAEKLDQMEYEALIRVEKEEKERDEERKNIILPDSKIKGSDLVFISQIKRDGSGTEDVSEKDNSYLDDTIFTLNSLSLSNKTYIASEFNSYVVKLK